MKTEASDHGTKRTSRNIPPAATRNDTVTVDTVESHSSPTIPKKNKKTNSQQEDVANGSGVTGAGACRDEDPSESSSTTNTWNSQHENNSTNNSNSNNNEDNRTTTSSNHTGTSRRSRAYSVTSLPSIFTADAESVPDHDREEDHGGTHGNDDDDDENNNGGGPSVSTEQERQILLLMLLAQVCALHDATPRTFTVHVLELFERGILNRDSIHFLFELGLVPSISPTHKLLTAHSPTTTNGRTKTSSAPDTSTATNTNNNTSSLDQTCNTTTVPTTVTADSDEQQQHHQQQFTLTKSIPPRVILQQQRTQEASAIRSLLEEQEQQQQQKELLRKNKQKGKHHPQQAINPDATGTGTGTTTTNNDKPDNSTVTTTPWEVEHFPLSLSRYQREFHQIEIISAGAFGQVFHVSRKMDGCDYAMKKVTFDATGYSDSAIDQVVREVQCLAKVNDHPNIVRYYTSWLEPGWMTGGSSSSANTGMEADVTTSASEATPMQQQHKLVADLQQLMQTQHQDHMEEVSHSYVTTKDDMEFSSFGGRYPSSRASRRQRQQRRFSFGSSVESLDQSWDPGWEQRHADNDWSLGNESLGYRRGGGGGVRTSFDDSYLSTATPSYGGRQQHDPSRSNVHNHKTKNGRRQQQQQQRKPAYRYEICLFIQMQLCHPATLADYIRERNRQIPESDHIRRIGPALDIFRQIASGLAHVHTNGIIHRDLKPANIFASKDGTSIKIGDFGLSKCTTTASAHHHHQHPPIPTSPPAATTTTTTTTASPHHNHHHHDYWQDPMHHGAIIVPKPNSRLVLGYGNGAVVPPPMDDPLTVGIGTASYASPEQVKSRSYGTKADIFSLGLILLELLCCFETEHERYHNFQQCRQKQILPEWITDEYPKVAALILTCTQQDPCQRPTAKELLQTIPVPTADRHGNPPPHHGPDHHAAAANSTALTRYYPPEFYHLRHILGSAQPPSPSETAAFATTTSIIPRPTGGFSPAMIKDVVVDKLQGQLAKKEEQLVQQQNELAEKDRIIESMRRELERMQGGGVDLKNANNSDEDKDDDAASSEFLLSSSRDDARMPQSLTDYRSSAIALQDGKSSARQQRGRGCPPVVVENATSFNSDDGYD